MYAVNVHLKQTTASIFENINRQYTKRFTHLHATYVNSKRSEKVTLKSMKIDMINLLKKSFNVVSVCLKQMFRNQ